MTERDTAEHRIRDERLGPGRDFNLRVLARQLASLGEALRAYEEIDAFKMTSIAQMYFDVRGRYRELAEDEHLSDDRIPNGRCILSERVARQGFLDGDGDLSDLETSTPGAVTPSEDDKVDNCNCTERRRGRAAPDAGDPVRDRACVAPIRG